MQPLHEPVRAFALLAIIIVLSAGSAAADDHVAARVNATPISRKALNDVVEGTMALEKRAPDATTTLRLRRAALDSLIDFELLYQASLASGVVIADTEVDREVQLNKSRFPDEQSYREALRRKGMTPEDLRFDTRRMLAVNRYLERTIGRQIDVTAEEVGKFYQERRSEFHRPAEVRASHILIRVEPGASEAQRQAARTKARDVLALIRGGADFAETARKYSQDRATAARGGDLGFFASGTMLESFEEPVFALAPGQVTDVFETPYGFHIAKVTDRTIEGTRSLDETRDTIREHLTKIERERLQAKHVEALRSAAKIEIEDPELASRAEAGQAAP